MLEQYKQFVYKDVPDPEVGPGEVLIAVKACGIGVSLGGDPPLVIVNDGHRPTPTPRVLEWIDQFDPEFLDRAPFLIACGTHGEPQPDHLEKIFGRYLDRVTGRVDWHDCRNQDSMVKLGQDHFGKDVYLNRIAVEADRCLVITSAEPHYFAGFTGGRKSFFPGLTDLATVERNHNLANSLDCAPLRLEGNPMSEHLQEMLGFVDLGKVASIQLVVDAGHRVSGIFCGGLQEAFLEAARASEELYAYPVDEPYDLVLAEVRPPLDRSLYQIQKALENTQMAVRDGGTIAVVAACEDGVGSEHFFELADIWDREKNAPRDGVARFGSHKLSRVNAMTRRINVRLYSQLSPETPRQVFYEPVANLQALVGECLNGKNKRLAVVHDAGHSVLKVTKVT